MNEGQNPYENQGQAYEGNRRGSWGEKGGNSERSSGSYGGGNRSGGSYSGGSNYNRGGGGGYNRSGGGGYNRGGGGYNRNGGGQGGQGGQGNFQRRQYTEEDLKNARYPKAVVLSGNEFISDKAGLDMAELAKAFYEKEFTIRTGGLKGTDEMVERTVPKVELHLPFKNFNQKEAESQYTSEVCLELAKRQWPELDSMQSVPKAILSKNPRLVFGRFLNAPAQLVIVWSEDGCEHPREVTTRSGNAGHIVKLAFATGIRVINIQRPDGKQRALSYLESLNVQQEPQPTTATNQQPQQGYGNSGTNHDGNGGNQGYGNSGNHSGGYGNSNPGNSSSGGYGNY